MIRRPQKGQILPEDASHMSTLSISLAPQNIYGPGHLGRDALSRAMGLDSGFPGFEYDEDAEENRRLAGRNAEEYVLLNSLCDIFQTSLNSIVFKHSSRMPSTISPRTSLSPKRRPSLDWRTWRPYCPECQ